MACDDCGGERAKINGSALARAVKMNGGGKPFGRIRRTSWVEICPACHAEILGEGGPCETPFLCADSVMRTVSDFRNRAAEVLEFCGMQFTRGALVNSIALTGQEYATTPEVEQIGRDLLADLKADAALAFCEEVCKWGRGERVWANLNRHWPQQEELGQRLVDWFGAVAADELKAIRCGDAITGLGVSFASKHLRMLYPERFAVLDDVLAQGFGFAQNPRGYCLFLRLLQHFIAENGLKETVARVESGLFGLVRQRVRSTAPEA